MADRVVGGREGGGRGEDGQLSDEVEGGEGGEG